MLSDVNKHSIDGYAELEEGLEPEYAGMKSNCQICTTL